MRNHLKSSRSNKHIFCAHCGTQNPANDYACSRCGERLAKSKTDSSSNIEYVSCHQCQDTNDARSQYCWTCGCEMSESIPVASTSNIQATATSNNQAGDSASTSPNNLTHPPSNQVDSQQSLNAGTQKQAPHTTEEIPLQNTSGKSNGEIPHGVKRWNWAAFLMPAVWGLFSGVPFTGLLFAAAFLPSNAQLLIMIAASLFLGYKGNELAWRGKKWRSVEHFNSFQQQWTSWSIRLSAVIGVILVIFIFSQTGG
ncbi:MAG: hypothetical protein FI719_06045 [SAR202 cluster bacterium]|nr:hypothetical protein [SAR202 cluster bacterium]